MFSKLDLRSGYHQLTLAPESRYITTFATHKGLKRYTRLNFSTNSASEMFQKVVNEQIRDIPGSLNISDDVIVFGKTQVEHDAALRAVFNRFSEINLTLNKTKCEFNKSSPTFFGFVFSSQGITPDPWKVEAIKAATPPTTTSEVRSFLGMEHIAQTSSTISVMSPNHCGISPRKIVHSNGSKSTTKLSTKSKSCSPMQKSWHTLIPTRRLT